MIAMLASSVRLTGTGVLIDCGIVLIVAIFAFVGVKRGFATTLLNLIGTVLSALIATMISMKLSPFIFDRFMSERMITSMTNSIGSSLSTESIQKGIESSISGYPSFLQSAIENSLISFLSNAEGSIQQGAANVSVQIVKTAIRPIIVSLFAMIFFFLSYTLIKLLTGFLGKSLKGVNKVPLIGKVNKVFGGLIGGFQALVILTILIVVVSYFYKLVMGIKLPILDETIIFRFLHGLFVS